MKNGRAFSARAILALASAVALLGGAGASKAFAEEKVRDKASYAGVSELLVDSGSVDIEATSVGAGERLRVECRDFPAEFSLFADQNGGRLSLRVSHPDTFFTFGFGSRSPRLVLAIPRGSSIELRSASGDISLAGPESKRIILKTSSGELALSRASGEAGLESSSGSVRVESCGGNLSAVTSSGDVSIRDCRGDKKIETKSGSVELRTSSGKAEVSTSSGDVTVDGQDGGLGIRTSSGTIRLGKTNGEVEARSQSGDIKGRDIRLAADSAFATSSGSIEIGFSNGLSDLRFDLEARSGSLRAGSSSSDGGRLVSGSGKILVKGSSSSGDQSYSAR
jgi:hypothetical protein